MTSKDASSQDMRELATRLRGRAAFLRNTRGNGEIKSPSLMEQAASFLDQAALSTTPDIVEPPLRGLKEVTDEMVAAGVSVNDRFDGSVIGRGFVGGPMSYQAAGRSFQTQQEASAHAKAARIKAILAAALQAANGCGSPTLHPDTKSKIDGE